jgi:hypothetical protein
MRRFCAKRFHSFSLSHRLIVNLSPSSPCLRGEFVFDCFVAASRAFACVGE